jgi:hypothetical protein
MAQLRRMVAEPTLEPYSDAVLQSMLDSHLLIDTSGLRPSDAGYAPTYDLNACAADVWSEKAAALAAGYDFAADGASYQRSQQTANAQAMERKYRARRSARSAAMQTVYKEI